MRYFKILSLLSGVSLVAACTHKPKAVLMGDADALHQNEDQLTHYFQKNG